MPANKEMSSIDTNPLNVARAAIAVASLILFGGLAYAMNDAAVLVLAVPPVAVLEYRLRRW